MNRAVMTYQILGNRTGTIRNGIYAVDKRRKREVAL